MRVLVTGASGFLGRNLLAQAPLDWEIVALYRHDATFPAFVASCRGNIKARQCDLEDPAQTAGLRSDFGDEWDCCIYLAAKVNIPWSVEQPAEDLRVNTESLIHLLDAIRSRKLIYFSSGAVYDGASGEVDPHTPVNPTLPYAISKLACERYVEFYRTRRRSIGDALIVRFFGAYGLYEAPHKIFTRLLTAIALEGRRSYTIYGNGQNLIDAMYVDDAVEAILRMARGSHWNDIVNLAGGNPITIEALVREIARALGISDLELHKTGVAHESNNFWGSTAEMCKYYDFTPRIGLAEGMRRFRDLFVSRASV